MKRTLSFAVMVLALLTAGCATATRGTSEQVVFVSDPSGAEMTSTNGLKCVTPCTLEVERAETFTATFKLAGQEKTVFVDTEIPDEVAATSVANVLLTPIILIPVALAVDAASGANLNHTPNPVMVSFEGLEEPVSEDVTEKLPLAPEDQIVTSVRPTSTEPPKDIVVSSERIDDTKVDPWKPHIGGY